MKDLERLFKALGQETRLRILFLLRDQELCVCELENILGLSQPAISQHLRILKEAQLVTERRMGQWVLYYLHQTNLPDQLNYYLGMMEPGYEGPSPFSKEIERLKQLQEKPIIDHPTRQVYKRK